MSALYIPVLHEAGTASTVDKPEMTNTLDEASIILQPIRYRIYQELKKAGKPLYVDEVAKRLDIDRRLVSFHLATLEEHGFVTSEFKAITAAQSNPGKGKAGRFFSLTEKADVVLRRLKKEI
jgi:predicted ArsR family transcriptional regulator